MKFFTGWIVAAGLVVVATGAHAQMAPVSDFGGPGLGGPFAAVPPEAPRPGYGYGPTLLPWMEVYTVVRESGFSPLGIPHQRGLVYTIAVIDRGGADGRLIIDARTGRVIRFMPSHGIGDNFNDDFNINYGPQGALPPMTDVRSAPRPPRPIPRVASRTVPVPKASPLAAKPAPEPAQQQSAAALPKPAEAQTPPPAAATTGAAQAMPSPQIAPTQDMPVVQGLE